MTARFQPIRPRGGGPEPGQGGDGGGFTATSLLARPARPRGAEEPAAGARTAPGGWLAAAVAEADAALRESEAAAAAQAVAAAREEGRAEGYAAGRAAGRAEALAEAADRDAARLAAAAEAVAATLREAAATAQAAVAAQAEEAAEALARLLLAALDSALPGAAAAGPEAPRRLADLIATLRPALAEDEPRIVVRVAPALAAALAAHLAALDPRFEVAADETLAPGDARVEWRGGAAETVLERRRRAVREALAAAGLGE